MNTNKQLPVTEQENELKNLSCLYEITKHLASASNLQDCLEKVVATLAAEKGMENGTVTIVNPTTGELEIEVAHNITAEARRRGRYKLGEGITGKVVATGEPILVPQIGDEPLFLNRTRTRGDERKKKASFLCVPIKVDGQSIGALSIDREYPDGFGSQSENDLRFLTVVSGLIAQTVQRVQKVNEEKEALRQENSKLRRELSARNRIEEIIGNSSRMQEVFDMVHRVADSGATVLLRGESGTGKTLVAKALHYNSGRRNGPFVVVNCSALPETLLESELFGHEKGAFTGANSRKKGRFEVAKGGTLFLDEIGEISPAVQVKLLGVIQERTFQRLGGSEILKADIRLVAATNRDLEKAVQEGHFREDLYYRLNVFPVYLPPLRERRTDILLLAEYFLDKYARENNKVIRRISTSAIDLLIQYHWPGNVRELQNCMERAVLICDGETIKSIHLPPTLQSAETVNSDKPLSLATAVENFERELIIDALKKCKGNQTRAAKYLDTSLRIINYKIHNYRIDPKQFKTR
ncbi:sigma-54-dependent Fis family transcriptional regulator [Desulfolithobacter dissulfuricans]|uniref:Sigma-54-dependent Fis family transcriptional regulator n=1 Tax=Desulfolithobacter dissulfuricans TaxID=2795293 RepID=A0A915XLF9_9BACT|nr:sigma 54-interacting transcriptional regulator [Desulfolithobacter dissulfuricans]BCO10708.1 sigma-54-dependent Fis family transcriptional regulator [Desulfolithobacter dissulfuricans]